MPKKSSPQGKQSGRKWKTVFELEEEEEEKRRVIAEGAAQERAREEANARFWAWTVYIPTPKKVKRFLFPPDWVKQTILRLSSDSAASRVNACFKQMHVLTRAEKKQWLKLWCEMDKTLSNRVPFRTFMTYFNLTDDTWSRRVYDIMNAGLNGSLQFEEFLGFCANYCYIDKHKTIELSFRMISRRGATFKPILSVLDLEDMRQFVRFRFKMKEPAAIQKRALDVINYIDADGNGSIYLDEYEAFTQRNPVFVRFTHVWQQHLRKCLFGIKYWVEKSRHIKADNARGLDNLALLFRMNLDAENFAGIDLLDPVVDERGKPVLTLAYIPPPQVFGSGAGLVGGTSDARATGTAAAAATPGFTNPALPRADDDSVSTPLPLPAPNPTKLPPLPPPGRTMLAWHGPVSNALSLIMTKKYSEEFAEVFILKLEQKLARKAKKARDSELARAVASHTYKRLVGICGDIIYGRKWLRLAYNHWLERVGMERRATPGALKAADEARLVARKRMANLITKENVKEVSLRAENFSPDGIAQRLEEERRGKEAAMFGPKDGLSAIAAKLEEEGNLVDDMHIRILENCQKQEEMMDDTDAQCATYIREKFLERNKSSLGIYRHERLSSFVRDRPPPGSGLPPLVPLLQHSYKMRQPFAFESDAEESDAESV